MNSSLFYKKTKGKDGYVSLEVNPHLAHDTKGSTGGSSARLWAALNRPNILIKIRQRWKGCQPLSSSSAKESTLM